jgi:hypothetical protein
MTRALGYLPDRRLAGPEIDLVIHLLKCGGATMPVRLPGTARERAGTLARLGLVSIWHRQSIELKRAEGPFYSLTRIGAMRAEALAASARRREIDRSEVVTDLQCPPPRV